MISIHLRATAASLVVMTALAAPSAAQPSSKPPVKDRANTDDTSFARLLHADVDAEDVMTAGTGATGDWSPEALAALSRDPKNLVPQLVAIGAGTTRVEDGLRLTEPQHQTGVITPDAYRPPLVIEAVALTQGTNLRLYYGRGMVIFNWEVRPDELRYHDPATGEQVGVPGKGRVTPNEWHTLRWEITATAVRLWCDGQLRGEEQGDFTKAHGRVGVGTAWGSTVRLKSLTVTQPPPPTTRPAP